MMNSDPYSLIISKDNSDQDLSMHPEEEKKALFRMDEHWQSCSVPDSKVEDILKFPIQMNSISSGNQDLKSRMDTLLD